MGKWENGKMGECENGGMGEWENGRMGEWENGKMGKWGNGKMGECENVLRRQMILHKRNSQSINTFFHPKYSDPTITQQLHQYY